MVVVQSLVTGERKILQRGGYYARYLSGGYVAYVQEGTVFAAPFQLRDLPLIGQPVPAIEGVTSYVNNGSSQIAFSNNGQAVYLPGNDAGGASIQWMDREGKMTPLRATRAAYYGPRFSPDGKNLAVEIVNQTRDIWIYDWSRDTMSRLTFGANLRDRVPEISIGSGPTAPEKLSA